MTITATRTATRICGLLAVAIFGLISGCDADDRSSGGNGGGRKIIIGIIAKSQSNAVFQVAHRGAIEAANEFAVAYRVEIDLRIETPVDEDAQKQADAVEALSTLGTHGIAISCSDARTLTPAINKAVERGSVVVCFDSDAADSKRLCYYGTDDIDCGRQVMAKLARSMGEVDRIAILAGNQAAPNLQKRKDGVLQELAAHPEMVLVEDGVIYHEETPEQAADKLNAAQSTNPVIEGWALIGGSPLFTRNALRWPTGSVKVVSVDALPEMINYLDSGHVKLLLAQDCYGWGYESVRLLLDKIIHDKQPSRERIIAPLEPVTKGNAAAYRAKFALWRGKSPHCRVDE